MNHHTQAGYSNVNNSTSEEGREREMRENGRGRDTSAHRFCAAAQPGSQHWGGRRPAVPPASSGGGPDATKSGLLTARATLILNACNAAKLHDHDDCYRNSVVLHLLLYRGQEVYGAPSWGAPASSPGAPFSHVGGKGEMKRCDHVAISDFLNSCRIMSN